MADDDGDGAAARPDERHPRWATPRRVVAGAVLAVVVVGASAALALGGDDKDSPTGSAADEQASGATAAGGEPRFDEHLAQRALTAGARPGAATTSTVPGTPAGGGTGEGGSAATGSGGSCDPTCTQFPVSLPPLPETDPSDYACPEHWELDHSTGQMVNTGCAGVHLPTVHVDVEPPPPPPPPVILPETPTTTTSTAPPPPPPPTSPPTTGAG
jgi:hypothetical protein